MPNIGETVKSNVHAAKTLRQLGPQGVKTLAAYRDAPASVLSSCIHLESNDIKMVLFLRGYLYYPRKSLFSNERDIAVVCDDKEGLQVLVAVAGCLVDQSAKVNRSLDDILESL